MKRIYIIALFIALCTGIMSAQTTIFDRYADTDGVTTVYISKAMLRMMPDVGEGAGGLNIGEIASKLDNLQVLTCERKALVAKIMKETTAQTSKGYEILVKVNEGGEKTDIFQKSLGNNKMEYLIRVSEPSELTLIQITGNITPDDIRKMTSGK